MIKPECAGKGGSWIYTYIYICLIEYSTAYAIPEKIFSIIPSIYHIEYLVEYPVGCPIEFPIRYFIKYIIPLLYPIHTL